MQIHPAKQLLLVDVCECAPVNTRRSGNSIDMCNTFSLRSYRALASILGNGTLVVQVASHIVTEAD